MSESETYDEVTVADHGVTVTKRYEADEFPVPAIAFRFESERDVAVSVALSDFVPDGVAVEDLGFHPEYGSEYWDIEEEEINFERELEPGAEYTTVYGIRATGTDNVEQFLTEPTIAGVDPPLEGEADEAAEADEATETDEAAEEDASLVGEGDDAVKDVISGDADSVPGLDEEDEEDVETLDLKDPTGKRTAGDDGASGDAGTGEESTDIDGEATETAEDGEGAAATNGDAEAVEISGDTLITALANELREQEVSKDDVKLLRKAFDLAAEDQGSVKARVEKLQSDLSDILAYTDALEEFLDENGTGSDLIEDFREDVESFQDRLDSFEDDLDSLEDGVPTEEDFSALEEEVDDVAGTVEEVEDDVDEVESAVDSLDEELAELQDELEDVREDVGSGDVDERIDDIEAEIEELKEWREQLSSVIGGAE